MDPRDIVGRTLETGRGVTQRSQERLESLVGQLQRLSEDQLDQVAALVSELRDRSLLSGEQVAGFVDRRVRAQLAALGIATRADLERVEGKLDRLERRQASTPSGASGGAGGKASGKASSKPKSKSTKGSGGKDTKAPKGKPKTSGAKTSKGKTPKDETPKDGGGDPAGGDGAPGGTGGARSAPGG